MTFEEILDHAIAMLQRRGRLTYGTLKRQFQLDDAEKHARRALELHPELKDVQSTLDKILRLKTERKRK